MGMRILLCHHRKGFRDHLLPEMSIRKPKRVTLHRQAQSVLLPASSGFACVHAGPIRAQTVNIKHRMHQNTMFFFIFLALLFISNTCRRKHPKLRWKAHHHHLLAHYWQWSQAQSTEVARTKTDRRVGFRYCNAVPTPTPRKLSCGVK